MKRFAYILIACLVLSSCKGKVVPTEPVKDKFSVSVTHTDGVLSNGTLLTIPSFKVGVSGEDWNYTLQYSVDGGQTETVERFWINDPRTVNCPGTMGRHTISGKVFYENESHAFADTLYVKGKSVVAYKAQTSIAGQTKEFSMDTVYCTAGQSVTLLYQYEPAETQVEVGLQGLGDCLVETSRKCQGGGGQLTLQTIKDGSATLVLTLTNGDEQYSIGQPLRIKQNTQKPIEFTSSVEDVTYSGYCKEVSLPVTVSGFTGETNSNYTVTITDNGTVIYNQSGQRLSKDSNRYACKCQPSAGEHIVAVTITDDKTLMKGESTTSYRQNTVAASDITLQYNDGTIWKDIDNYLAFNNKTIALRINTIPSDAFYSDLSVNAGTGLTVAKTGNNTFNVTPQAEFSTRAYLLVKLQSASQLKKEIECIRVQKVKVNYYTEYSKGLYVKVDSSSPLLGQTVEVSGSITYGGYCSYTVAKSTEGEIEYRCINLDNRTKSTAAGAQCKLTATGTSVIDITSECQKIASMQQEGSEWTYTPDDGWDVKTKFFNYTPSMGATMLSITLPEAIRDFYEIEYVNKK